MPVNYLELRQQAKVEAGKAKEEIKRLGERRAEASALLAKNADAPDEIRQKIERAATLDPRLRCAKPTNEPLNKAYALPNAPQTYTLIAADGSQINPNPHEPLHYFLINLGAIEYFGGTSTAPQTHTSTQLHFAEYTTSGSFSDEQVSLERDKNERVLLARLAAQATQKPLLTLTDGPLELWGQKATTAEQNAEFSKDLEEYLKALDELHRIGAATAGYVDKPRADLLVRMLEIVSDPPPEAVGRDRPFRGVTDALLLKDLLAYGQRSAIFATQSQSASKYTDHRALHFFSLNVGRESAPWLARVEIPAWVASNKVMLDNLHAVLMQQTAIFGAHAYPYVLHRAHEIALVKFEEHEEVSLILLGEMRGLGIEPGQLSQKQASKNLRGRRRHKL